VRRRSVASGEQQAAAPVGDLAADDLAPGADRYPASEHRVVQRAEQARALNAEADRARHVEVGVARIQHHFAERVAPVDVGDRRRVGSDFPGQPERGQHGQPGRLDQQARAERAGLGEPLVERHRVAPAMQRQRRGQPGDAAPGDGDVELPHGAGLAAVAGGS